MACPDVMNVLEPYVDSELDLSRTVEFERHLATCPSCAQKVASLRALHGRLQSSDLRFTAPASLKRDVLRRTEARVTPFRAWKRSLFPLAAAAVLAVVAFSSIWYMQNRGADREIARELVGAHVRSLMVNHLIDVPSSDQHTVKPWFEGKIDFAPQVEDFAAQGYPLAGGRLDYIAGRSVAVVVYHRRQHPINVFEWPSGEGGDSAPTNSVRDGFNLLHWRSRGMEYWATSDLNYNELAAFADLIRGQRP